jgi:hypothetical protein
MSYSEPVAGSAKKLKASFLQISKRKDDTTDDDDDDDDDTTTTTTNASASKSSSSSSLMVSDSNVETVIDKSVCAAEPTALFSDISLSL